MLQEPKTDQMLTLSASQLSKRLGCSVRHIRRLCAAGKMPKPLTLGRSVRWLAVEIEAWLEAGAPNRQTWNEIRQK